MSLSVKICGVKDIDVALATQKYGADFIGFVFYTKSPRHIEPNNCAKILSELHKKIKSVIVTVDITNSDLDFVFKQLKPDYIQCHGKESVARIKEIKNTYETKVIKGIAVRNEEDISAALQYKDVADIILFDAKDTSAIVPGGNGVSFDWRLLENREFDFDWMLSGGVNISNLSDAVKTTGTKMIDLSSAVETSPGIKNIELIRKFLEKSKTI